MIGSQPEQSGNICRWDTAVALAQSALVGGILGALGGGVQLGKDAASGTQTDAPVRETTEDAAKNETAASGTETAESTAVNDDPARHTQTEQRIIQAYKNSTDDALRRMNYLI